MCRVEVVLDAFNGNRHDASSDILKIQSKSERVRARAVRICLDNRYQRIFESQISYPDGFPGGIPAYYTIVSVKNQIKALVFFSGRRHQNRP